MTKRLRVREMHLLPLPATASRQTAKQTSAQEAPRAIAASSQAGMPAHLLRLQRQYGNRYVQRLAARDGQMGGDRKTAVLLRSSDSTGPTIQRDANAGEHHLGFGTSPHAVSDADSKRLATEDLAATKKREDEKAAATNAAQAKDKKADPNKEPGKGEAGFGKHPHALTEAEAKKQEAAAAEEKKMADVLVPYLKLQGGAFLDQWLLQMISAKSDASAPVKDGSEYWYLALVGNLMWAASCFMPGAGVVTRMVGAEAMGMSKLGKVMYATMQMAGGLAGAGVAQTLAADSSGTPTGKDVVSDALNDKRQQLGAKLEGDLDWLADDLIRSGFTFQRFERDRTTYLRQVDRVLWSGLFPAIGYADLKAIYHSGLDSITGALGEFKEQYERHEAIFSACMSYYGGIGPVDASDRARFKENPERRGEENGEGGTAKYCTRLYPFRPRLNFTIKE